MSKFVGKLNGATVLAQIVCGPRNSEAQMKFIEHAYWNQDEAEMGLSDLDILVRESQEERIENLDWWGSDMIGDLKFWDESGQNALSFILLD